MLNECALNLDESIFALEGGGISPVVGVVGDGGAAAATAATVARRRRRQSLFDSTLQS